jgi:peptidoglycan LD-endopeptidase CwlK
MDPRLAALTKTLIKAEGRAKQIDQASPRRASATNRIRPEHGAAYQTSVGSYKPLSPKQFAASLREKGVPRAIAKRIVLVDVEHRGYDGKTHQGQIVVHKDLQRSIARVFHRILTETDFPIRSVVPVSDKRFGWSDRSSVAKNNSSGFNFRLVSGSREVSDHAFGTAVDINPEINPWVKAGTKNRNYNPSVKGTLDRFSKVVKIFKQEGWKWGGDWKNSKDWQHFYRADIPKRDFGKREVPE